MGALFNVANPFQTYFGMAEFLKDRELAENGLQYVRVDRATPTVATPATVPSAPDAPPPYDEKQWACYLSENYYNQLTWE